MANRDGRFELYYRDGWAHLAVYPPTEDGRPVYHEEVTNRMRLLGVPRVSPSVIRELVDEASAQPVPLVEWPGGERLASAITVDVSEDAMSATVAVSAPRKGAASPTREDVERALEAAGVAYGVDEDAITELLSRRRYGERVLVARGEPPVHARSAHVLYHFDPDRGKPYLVMEFDRINLRELSFIENKEAGDLLAELVPSVDPRDGRTVRGDRVPANREITPVALKAGPDTELTPDGLAVRATADGNVRLVDGAVVIEPVVSVESVNYETGNIHFDGSVVIEKDIADGFVVEAGGDVQVGRGVGRSTIKAGGNVLLKAGINGNGSGRIECGGNVFAKYIESSAVSCRGNVFAEEAIMHSHVSAWKHCVLNGRRSEVIASNLVVAGSLWCKKLGSFNEAPVFVAMGIDPEMLASFRRAREQLAVSETRLDEVNRQIAAIDRALIDGRTDEKLYASREQLMSELAALRDSLPEVRHSVHSLRESLEASRESRLVVEDTIFKGAIVLFGTYEYHAPDKGARKTVLRSGHGGVVEEGFNPADRPTITFDHRRE
ncbi:MAG: DUF342 domain-containing protein [Spirochaetota bacterium]